MSLSQLISKTLQVSESKRTLSSMEPIKEAPHESESKVMEPTVKNSAYATAFSDDSASSVFRGRTDYQSKINFLSKILNNMSLDYRQSVINVLPRHSTTELHSDENLPKKSDEEILIEEFPVHLTCLMNEDNYWGCFYNFPELYADVFSPVVRIRKLEDVAELVNGELTRDMITACLTYLRRTPILGDLAYIKLDLSSKHLQNIDVLAHYKFLVYLDLSSNLLTELTVLSYLLYLQYLSVAFNRLSTVLGYEIPQWFLTEVHYKYNSVKRIRDLTLLWSLTILDLSHNNIKCITGLENLKFLRRLDLSFNHIQRLENLNHLRLLWLDLSYNNISSFEFSTSAGLWTLLHLEYLNLNENNLTSLRMFAYCTRLRQLYVRNNRLSVMLEVPVYMCQLRRLVMLDLRANPICSIPAYKTVIINTFPILLNLDAAVLDPVEQRTLLMDTRPDITTHTTRKLLRLIYIEQLSKARVSPFVPPADTTDVPIVVLVGQEGVGKGTLARRLATECISHIKLAVQHTTAKFHFQNHYKEICMKKFDDMLLEGDFLTYSEMDGESYGLSREEAFVTDGKVKVACLDLPAALLLKLRGYRPYLILTSRFDKDNLKRIQEFRKTQRILYSQGGRSSVEVRAEQPTLQVMFSGRIIITGIINEIIQSLPDEKGQNEFVLGSQCSLMMDSETRQATQEHAARAFNILTLLHSSSDSLDDEKRQSQEMEERSLYSLFKESQGTAEHASDVGHQPYQEHISNKDKRQSRSKYTDKHSSISHPMHSQTKTTNSKSVTFTSESGDQSTTAGMIVDPIKERAVVRYRLEISRDYLSKKGAHSKGKPPGQEKKILENQSGEKDIVEDDYWTKEDSCCVQSINIESEPEMPPRSISTKMPWPLAGWQARLGSHVSMDESDLWLAFLTEAGYLAHSDANAFKVDSDENQRAMMEDDIHGQTMTISTSYTPTMGLKDPYEHIHHHCPGLFWDTVTMDDPKTAFIKVHRIIRNIVNSQKKLKPMFDIDFANLRDYPTVEKKVDKIRKQIAAQQLFY